MPLLACIDKATLDHTDSRLGKIINRPPWTTYSSHLGLSITQTLASLDHMAFIDHRDEALMSHTATIDHRDEATKPQRPLMPQRDEVRLDNTRFFFFFYGIQQL